MLRLSFALLLAGFSLMASSAMAFSLDCIGSIQDSNTAWEYRLEHPESGVSNGPSTETFTKAGVELKDASINWNNDQSDPPLADETKDCYNTKMYTRTGKIAYGQHTSPLLTFLCTIEKYVIAPPECPPHAAA